MDKIAHLHERTAVVRRNQEAFEDMVRDSRAPGDEKHQSALAYSALNISCYFGLLLEWQAAYDAQAEQIRVLQEALNEAADELQNWWDDQGSYGTYGYEEMIPRFKALAATEPLAPAEEE